MFVTGSDVAQTFPAGEQIVSFSGGGSGVSASAGPARKAIMSASELFMAPNALCLRISVLWGREPGVRDRRNWNCNALLQMLGVPSAWAACMASNQN